MGRFSARSLLGRVMLRAGYRLRMLYWSLRLGTGLRIGRYVRLGPHLTLKPQGAGYIELGNGVELEYDVNMESHAALRVGAGTFIGHGTTIGCLEQVAIGKDCLIGEYVSIRDSDHGFASVGQTIRSQGQVSSPVLIGDDVWIGAKCTVTAGVRIGSGSVIGANAVVTRDVPPCVVAVGVPAHVIKRRGDA